MSNPTNNTTQIGRLTSDPELRELADDKSVCNMRLAVDGLAGRNETGYIDVAVWGKAGGACAKTLTQGWLVAVAGELQVKPWKRDERSGVNVSIPFATVKFLAAPRGEREPVGVTGTDGEEIAF